MVTMVRAMNGCAINYEKEAYENNANEYTPIEELQTIGLPHKLTTYGKNGKLQGIAHIGAVVFGITENSIRREQGANLRYCY